MLKTLGLCLSDSTRTCGKPLRDDRFDAIPCSRAVFLIVEYALCSRLLCWALDIRIIPRVDYINSVYMMQSYELCKYKVTIW